MLHAINNPPNYVEEGNNIYKWIDTSKMKKSLFYTKKVAKFLP
jgi:hypothetical protein